jgi:glycosyltransferase domain-containing protein
MHDFTLFVPVRDRQYNLKSICAYYNDLDCKKIIVDSSIEPLADRNIIEDAGFDYVYYGPTKYVDKIHRIHTELIDTEFSLDCSDDDLVLKEAIKKSVEFLRHNDEYVACDGENLWLDKGANTLFVKHPNKFFGPLKENFCSKEAIDRVTFDFNCCMTKQHSVIRKNVSLLVWNTLKNYPPIQTICFVERFHAFVTAIMGNSKKLPDLFCIRNQGEKVTSRPDLQAELREDIAFIDNLDDEHLKPFVNLLVENTNDLSYQEGFIFVKNIIRDQLNGGQDLCHIDTSDWDVRHAWDKEREKYHTQIREAVDAMTL